MKRMAFIIAILLGTTLGGFTNLLAQETANWSLVNAFSASTGRQHAIVFDGEYIYTAAHSKSSVVQHMFYKYDLEGNLLDEFDIPGMVNDTNYLRDMTFDGQYFYGVDAHFNDIWCVDLHNKTLIGKIETTLTNPEDIDPIFNPTGRAQLGTCTYDPVHDAFWVGERATNQMPNLKLDLYLVNRNGEVIKTATKHNLGQYTVHGTGYFTDTDGSAHLYLNSVSGQSAHVFDYNIDTDELNPNYIFNLEVTPGWNFTCTAGGAYIGEHQGNTYFFADIDKSPNLIGIYAIGDFVPVEPVAPEGDIFFDFNNGLLNWTLIDADGDGQNWLIRQNWTNTQNPCSVTSASSDPQTSLPLTPQNYMVTRYKLDCEEISFIACAQDQSYPAEHIGVAVSTTSGTDAEAFTMVWETTLTAKSAGNWYYYSVDLREYQGQEIYVALVHFNCTNQFMVNIDDITLYRTYNAVDEANANAVSIFPNPTSERVFVENENIVNSYEVYDITGAMLFRHEVGTNNFNIDVRHLPAGTYLLRMFSEGMVQTKRFVKK